MGYRDSSAQLSGYGGLFAADGRIVAPAPASGFARSVIAEQLRSSGQPGNEISLPGLKPAMKMAGWGSSRKVLPSTHRVFSTNCGVCSHKVNPKRDSSTAAPVRRFAVGSAKTRDLARNDKLFSDVLLFLVRCYMVFLSPFFGGACKFEPSCSKYAYEAIVIYGARRGTVLALKRLLRCRPFTVGGFDPVPDLDSADQRQLPQRDTSTSWRVWPGAARMAYRRNLARHDSGVEHDVREEGAPDLREPIR